MLFLTACGEAPAGGANTADRLAAGYENALPVESQLILGTLMLEGTDRAVSAEQAAELLPLWQMMKELAGNDTAAAQERSGLIEQIQETMAAEQIRAIADMKLTRDDLRAYMQEYGLMQMRWISGTPDASADGDFAGGMMGEPPAGFQGGPPGGDEMPGGGGMIIEGEGLPPGGDLSPEQIATLDARRAGSGSAGSPTALLDELLEMLESKQTE
jgi:hypothetical protein